MKKISFYLILVCMISGFSFAADPAEGFWLSVDDKTGKPTAGWEIYTIGDTLYGKILSVAGFPQNITAFMCKESYQGFPVAGKVNYMTVVGTSWIYDLKNDKPGIWSKGQIVDPNDGKIYKCRINYHPSDGKKYKTDTLEMRGEIGLGIGRSQFWQKCTREEASGLL